ncbi:MAG: hypothetical protein WC460_03100 [Patescibacteria group bacterium]
MSDRGSKLYDIPLVQAHDFMRAFIQAKGNTELLQFAIETTESMKRIINLLTDDQTELLSYEEELRDELYRYPLGFRILPVDEQVHSLLKYFPNLNASHVNELAKGNLPKGAEGWAVIPKPDRIGTYYEAFTKALQLIAENRVFKIWLEDELLEQNISLFDKTKQCHSKLNAQPGDLWVFPFQFGKRWSKHSYHMVCFENNEFGLGPYEIAILLLTHPNRIIKSIQIQIGCLGCEYKGASANANFDDYLIFYRNSIHDRLDLGCFTKNDLANTYPAISGFLSLDPSSQKT